LKREIAELIEEGSPFQAEEIERFIEEQVSEFDTNENLLTELFLLKKYGF
jgi:hypothetical protein